MNDFIYFVVALLGTLLHQNVLVREQFLEESVTFV